MVKIDPQGPDGVYNLATVYLGMDSIEKAYRFYDLTIKNDPIKAAAHYGKGICAKAMGNTDEALKLFTQALNIDPDYEAAKVEQEKLMPE